MDKNSINLEHIESLSELSGLRFTDKEKDTMLEEVRNIVDMLNTCADIEIIDDNKFNKIVSLDELRQDEVRTSFDKSIALSQAREVRDDYIVVPKEDL